MDQITLLAEDQQDFLVDLETEQPLTLHEEADFVFGMDMFRQEFASERCPFGMVRLHADCIDRDISLGGLDSVDFIGIDAEKLCSIGPSRQASAGRPLLKSDSASSQLTLNGIRVVMGMRWGRGVSPRTASLWSGKMLKRLIDLIHEGALRCPSLTPLPSLASPWLALVPEIRN